MDSRSVVNSASASRTALRGSAINSNTEIKTVTAEQTKTLTLVKTPSPLTYSAVGQTISYTRAEENPGGETLTGRGAADNKATVSCLATTLAPRAGTTCKGSYGIT